MEFKDRLRAARKHAGLTQKELAVTVGIDQTSVSDLERGKSASTSFLAQIARACRVSPIWLAEGTGEMFPQFEKAQYGPPAEVTAPIEANAVMLGPIDVWDDETPLDDDEVYVPFLKEVELSAGSGRTSIQQSSRRKLRFGKITLRNQGVQPNNAVCVSVAGNSMEPVLPHGSTVGVDRGCTSITDGKMYALDHDGELRVKTLYRLPGGGLRVRSFNRDEHPDEEYTREQLIQQGISVVGRVFWSSALW